MKKTFLILMLAGALFVCGCTAMHADAAAKEQGGGASQAQGREEPILAAGQYGQPIATMSEEEFAEALNKVLTDAGFKHTWEKVTDTGDIYFSYYETKENPNFYIDIHVGYGGMDVFQLAVPPANEGDEMILKTASAIVTVLDGNVDGKQVEEAWRTAREKKSKTNFIEVGEYFSISCYAANESVYFTVGPKDGLVVE